MQDSRHGRYAECHDGLREDAVGSQANKVTTTEYLCGEAPEIYSQQRCLKLYHDKSAVVKWLFRTGQHSVKSYL